MISKKDNAIDHCRLLLHLIPISNIIRTLALSQNETRIMSNTYLIVRIQMTDF